jgi:chorismate-pyruvate lyase
VAAAIRKGDTPLGRVLIEHNVLRRIELSSLLRIAPCPRLHAWFSTDRPCYGRLAIIHCDEAPAVELLEVVAP